MPAIVGIPKRFASCWQMEPMLTTRMKNDNGVTSLYFAGQRGHFEMVQLLLENRANTYIAMKSGKIPANVAKGECKTRIDWKSFMQAQMITARMCQDDQAHYPRDDPEAMHQEQQEILIQQQDEALQSNEATATASHCRNFVSRYCYLGRVENPDFVTASRADRQAADHAASVDRN
jgi:ankyrin repeat protein